MVFLKGFPIILELAARLCHMAQNFALNLSIAQGQWLRIFLLSFLDVVFFKTFFFFFFAMFLLNVIYNVITWISNRNL
jgi:hypothetical protein